MKLLVTTQAIDKNDPILGFFHRWVEAFAEHFEHVYVICLRKGEHSLPANVTIYSLGKEDGENRVKYICRFYTYFARVFFRFRVEYVFFHMGAIYNILSAPFFCIRSFNKTKFYWWKAHGHINSVGKIALMFVDRVYTPSAESFPVNTRKKSVVGHAVDTDLFKPTNKARDAYMVTYTGRIAPVKHIEDVVDVARILHPVFPTLRFTIIGPVTDVAYGRLIHEKITAYALNNVVNIGESIKNTELPDVYTGASFFLNTSHTHSMDKTVLESILCGCIPITHNKAFKSLLQPYGLYDEEGTPDSYARILAECIKNETCLESVRNTLREYVAQNHSIKTLHNRIFQ